MLVMRRNVGLYNLHLRAMGGGEKLTLALAEHLSAGHNVWLFYSEPLDVALLEQFFGVDLSRVRFVPLEPGGRLLRHMAGVRGWRVPDFSLHHYLQLKKFNLDLFINNSYASGLACPAQCGIYMCMFPHHPTPHHPTRSLPRRAGDALVDRFEQRLTGYAVRDVYDSYSTIAAISGYSAEWFGKFWGRRPEIIFPLCEDMGPSVASAKRKRILHVGRFIADLGGKEYHHKGQGVLLEAFKGMTGLHRDGWELHFAGSVGVDEESAKYTAALVESAKGFPVRFHMKAGLGELRDLYRTAAIYWHATGFGYPASDYPAKQEHFGITTVEAMSAGAVPVVYGSGGQKEVVTHGVDGLCWDDTSGLVSQTLSLIGDPDLRGRLSRQAVTSSRRFGREAFAASVDRLVGRLMSGHPAQTSGDS
jgi:glycosyltransferase involved in cell wall biosynthesis